MVKNFFSALLYYLFIIPLSHLPFSILYFVSDVLFLLFYYGIGYRKKVVFANIRNSFPNQSGKDHRLIAKNFYRHFCDVLLESLKLFTISEAEVRKRLVFKNVAVADRYYDQGRSVIMAAAHYSNWELLAVGVDMGHQHQAIAIYRPLKNLFFDRKMRETRSKFGVEMIPLASTKESFIAEKGSLTSTIFAIDQSPPSPHRCYWMKFLSQETGVFFGTENYAKKYNYPVIFCHLRKQSRGHYVVEIEDVSSDPINSPHGEITEKVTRMLEADILANPEYWLWTHKRWKKKRPQGVEMH